MVFKAFGGDKRDRTADLLNAIQALSQLSYTPIFGLLSDSFCIIAQFVELSIGFCVFIEFFPGGILRWKTSLWSRDRQRERVPVGWEADGHNGKTTDYPRYRKNMLATDGRIC